MRDHTAIELAANQRVIDIATAVRESNGGVLTMDMLGKALADEMNRLKIPYTAMHQNIVLLFNHNISPGNMLALDDVEGMTPETAEAARNHCHDALQIAIMLSGLVQRYMTEAQ